MTATNISPKTRSFYWDNIKGLLILLVVFAHVLFQMQNTSRAINTTVDFIYLFHMPAFVFVSGYFGKSERSRSARSVIKLIALYFIFNSIIGFIYGFSSLLTPLYSYWYLIALVVWRLTAHHIAKFKNIVVILFAIAFFAGFFPSIDNTLAIARIIGFYPFYMAGYLLSAERSDIITKQRKRITMGIVALAGVFALGAAFLSFCPYTDNTLQMGAYSDGYDALNRLFLFLIAFLAIYALRCLVPDIKIPLLTMIGRNSLWIFLFHRPFTLLISDRVSTLDVSVIILIAVISAIALCLAFGNDFVCRRLDRFADSCADVFTGSGNGKNTLPKAVSLVVALGFVVSAVASSYAGITKEDILSFFKGEYKGGEITSSETSNDKMYPAMTAEQKTRFDNAFTLTFAGDLILLEDQVKRAYNGSEYDFTDVFEYAEKYVRSADYAIGVFEGPMAGEDAGYTSGNFDDGKELHLNFPDSFAQAVKDAGFDLVTTANNHLLDKGEAGAKRTLDVLDKTGLDHTGSYRNAEEKQSSRVKLVERNGIKLAILSYTYGSNYCDTSELAEGELSYMTSVISGTSGELFDKLKANVEEDFRQARALSPDLIVVLPHIGTQFSNGYDEEQRVWFDIFKENGADIILGDHPHAVEPVVIEERDGRGVFTAYCPGNFANIYREKQGDTSMLVEVYIDRSTKKVIGGAAVPLYTQSPIDGNFRALPIYDIVNDAELRRQLSTDDLARAAEANRVITGVLFEDEMDISSITERYYFDKNGFIRMRTEGLEMTEPMKTGTLFSKIRKASTICFIGDSVTEGTKNRGCPWYEPILEHIPEKAVYNFSKGGCTASYMNGKLADIPKADLYVIALGTNDVRYRDAETCAMTAEAFVSEIDKLRQSLAERSPSARFVFIAPWYSTDGDPFSALPFNEKTALNEEFSDVLARYCSENGLPFINANEYIRDKLKTAPDREYLLDHIHPNSGKGVVMYSEAVLLN